MNTKKTIIAAFAILVGLGLLSFKGDDRNFKIAKNLDLFNSIFKELDMFYVDTVDVEKMIQNGVNGILSRGRSQQSEGDDYRKVRRYWRSNQIL